MEGGVPDGKGDAMQKRLRLIPHRRPVLEVVVGRVLPAVAATTAIRSQPDARQRVVVRARHRCLRSCSRGLLRDRQFPHFLFGRIALNQSVQPSDNSGDDAREISRIFIPRGTSASNISTPTSAASRVLAIAATASLEREVATPFISAPLRCPARAIIGAFSRTLLLTKGGENA